MPERPKIFSAINTIAISIPLFFLVIFLINPSFDNSLFFIAVIGILSTAIMIFVGLISIIVRKAVEKMKSYKYYFAIGIMTVCFGISGIICIVFQEFVLTLFLFVLALLFIGLYIIADTFKNTKLIK